YCDGGHKTGVSLKQNYFIPQRQYETGQYQFYVRSVYQNSELGSWKLIKDKVAITKTSTDVTLTWAPISSATQYEIVVHKIDSAGTVLVKGYDIDAAPWWNGSGVRDGDPRVVTSNFYTPSREYKPGFYNVWIRAQTSNGIGSWVEAYGKFEVK
ncbi:hypothetical protein MJH12_19415, partial [bacterium]|nr:hypothetical protein [bacterium]